LHADVRYGIVKRVRGFVAGGKTILWSVIARRSNRAPLRLQCSIVGVPFFFFFLIQILSFELGRFETGQYRNRSGPVTPVTAISGPVPVGQKTLITCD